MIHWILILVMSLWKEVSCTQLSPGNRYRNWCDISQKDKFESAIVKPRNHPVLSSIVWLMESRAKSHEHSITQNEASLVKCRRSGTWIMPSWQQRAKLDWSSDLQQNMQGSQLESMLTNICRVVVTSRHNIWQMTRNLALRSFWETNPRF